MTDRQTPRDRRPTTGDVEEILESLARGGTVDLDPAPSGSWEAIADRLGLDGASGASRASDGHLAPVVEIPSLRSVDVDARELVLDAGRSGAQSSQAADDRSAEVASAVERARAVSEAPTVGSLRPDGRTGSSGRRSSSRRWTRIGLAAAAASVAVVGGLTLIGDRAEAPVSEASATLVHEAAFDPVGERSTAAVDVIERDDDLVVEFTSADLPGGALADGEELELWLLSDDADGAVVGLVSLGTIDPAAPGSFTVPADVDLDEFSLVDISVEPDDGDPDHSGRSILRGRLGA